MRVRKILAGLLVMVVLVSMAGCNYIQRPSGAANNGSDISSKLSDLLIIPTFTYEDPTTEEEYNYVGPPLDDGEDEPEPDDGDDEPVIEPDPELSPFTSTFTAETLLSKIDEMITNMKVTRGVAYSATGVSDELLSGRSIKVLVPDDFPIDDENEAVEALAAQYNCAVNVRRVGTGSAYTAACRRAVLSGDSVDLMYVDNSNWGDVHTFTQAINSYINLELGDELNTFSSVFTEKFYTMDDLDQAIKHYHVASGIGAPYLLAYNKANVQTATLQESSVTDTEGSTTVYREISVTDPVEMYNNRTWGIDAFTEMLKASTSGTNVGIASVMDAINGLDIWYGMEDCMGFNLSANTGMSTLTMDAAKSKNVDTVQSWYWTVKGTDSVNFVGAFENASAWSTGTIYEKLFNRYTGTDAVKSYSFLACELTDFDEVYAMGELTASDWDFVAYPYGETYEDTYRAMTAEDFASKVQADEESAAAGDDSYAKEIVTPVAGWAGGFAVMKTCQNPSVALRIAEEYTKIWKAEYETPYLELMTTEQQDRYQDMKENIGISCVRAWAEKAADVNAVYPEYSKYFYGSGNGMSNTVEGQDPDVAATNRAYFLGLTFFDNNAALVTQPMYHKDEINTIYDPAIHTTWSAFMEGAPNQEIDGVKDTGRISQILNASLLPTTILFEW